MSTRLQAPSKPVDKQTRELMEANLKNTTKKVNVKVLGFEWISNHQIRAAVGEKH